MCPRQVYVEATSFPILNHWGSLIADKPNAKQRLHCKEPVLSVVRRRD